LAILSIITIFQLHDVAQVVIINKYI